MGVCGVCAAVCACARAAAAVKVEVVVVVVWGRVCWGGLPVAGLRGCLLRMCEGVGGGSGELPLEVCSSDVHAASKA